VLLPIPIICFIGALVTDLAYTSVQDMMWTGFSSWFLLAGLICGGFAAVPVGVAVDRTGALLVADDVGGTIWRVSHAEFPPTLAR
jgi:uncharacterized membrane protein